MFHTCKAMTTVDLSSFDTSKCLEMSQIFDHATGLQYVIGLDKLNTSSAKTFEEAFDGCSSLKVLDLSSFNTKNVENAYYPMQNGSTGHGFLHMLTGMTGLEKLIIGEGVVFNGNGSVSDTNRMKLPAPAAKAGFTAKWRNVETGELFDASQIPEKVAATYEAHYIANT
jgi:surface protein